MRVWQTIRAATLNRHSHEMAYVAVVLAGGYEEAGDHGRFRVEAGDVLSHERFEAHVDRFSTSGAVVLNLPLPSRHSFVPGAARVDDPDVIVLTAERSRSDAVEVLLARMHPARPRLMDWPDELAAALIRNPSLILSDWSEEHRIAPWTVTRGFTHVFGISPETYRARTRARQAWKAIQSSQAPLAQIAFQLGFADQSHMSRSVKEVTGIGPQAWRVAANGFKTATTQQV
jgi:AraC-like DNA-binding protein